MIKKDTQTLELIHEMKRKWDTKLNHSLKSIKFSQTTEAAIIELIFTEPNGNSRSETTNLDFITGEDCDDVLFKPNNDVVDNAQEFIELDGYSLLNCISNLFEKEAEEEINCLHQSANRNGF
jgi:hypothetical protein